MKRAGGSGGLARVHGAPAGAAPRLTPEPTATLAEAVPDAWHRLVADPGVAAPRGKVTLYLDRSVARLVRGMGRGYHARINRQVTAALAAGQPAISVDTRKKELVGDFRNAGREYRPKGQPEPLRVHDFLIPEPGRAAPCGVDDIGSNAGRVSLGIDHDMGELRSHRHPALVAGHGPRALSQGDQPDDHRRWSAKFALMTVVKPNAHDFSGACFPSGVLRLQDAVSRMPELQRRLIKLLSARQGRIPACVARSRICCA